MEVSHSKREMGLCQEFRGVVCYKSLHISVYSWTFEGQPRQMSSYTHSVTLQIYPDFGNDTARFLLYNCTVMIHTADTRWIPAMCSACLDRANTSGVKWLRKNNTLSIPLINCNSFMRVICKM